MTKRKELRFRAYVPILVRSGQNAQVLVPHDVSTSACYFDFPPSLAPGTYSVEIALNGTTPIEIAKARYFTHPPPTSGQKTEGPPGFGLRWNLTGNDAARLFGLLQAQSSQPSTDSKVAYLASEQSSLIQAIRGIGEQKQKGYRFLFTLVAAYFAYLSAPLHFTFRTVEQAAFYAAGGLWGSVILVHYSARFLDWLGRSVRRSAFLVKALAANRSWIFDNDGSYYAKSLFPSGTTYDDARAWTWMRDENSDLTDIERFPYRIEYNWSTTFFHFLVQALFAFGALQFLSIILRALRDPTSLFGADFRLFDGRSFSDVYSTFAIILLIWIQVCGNGCSHYQQCIWEARRISIDRPNPKFTGKAFREQHPALNGLFKVVMYLAWLYLLFARLVISILGATSPRWAFSHINWSITAVLVLYFVGKILYSKVQIEAEKDKTVGARSLRMIAQESAREQGAGS